MESQKIKSLEKTAAKCRRKVVRMIEASGAGHMGGALSCMDIVTALYFHFMILIPKPEDARKDDLSCLLDINA